jgi:hypothetical protein
VDGAELARALKQAATVVLGLTAVGVIAATIAPSLAGTTRPHPTLTGGLPDALPILANNSRVLAAPFLLSLLRFADTRAGRLVGDAIIAALAAFSAITVGIALGRWRGRLIPYLPHLPLEWAALITATAAWLLIRAGRVHGRQLLALGSVTAMLLCAAAAVETWATPHRHLAVSRRAARVERQLPRIGGLTGPADFAGAASAQTDDLALSPADAAVRAPAIAGPHQPPTP